MSLKNQQLGSTMEQRMDRIKSEIDKFHSSFNKSMDEIDSIHSDLSSDNKTILLIGHTLAAFKAGREAITLLANEMELNEKQNLRFFSAMDDEKTSLEQSARLKTLILEQAVKVIEEKDEQITKAENPRKTGTQATKLKAKLWQEKINGFVKEFKEANPKLFSGTKCEKFLKLETYAHKQLVTYVRKQLDEVRDPELRRKTRPYFKPPENIKSKIEAALVKISD